MRSLADKHSLSVTPIGISSIGWKFYIPFGKTTPCLIGVSRQLTRVLPLAAISNAAMIPLLYLFFPEIGKSRISQILLKWYSECLSPQPASPWKVSTPSSPTARSRCAAPHEHRFSTRWPSPACTVRRRKLRRGALLRTRASEVEAAVVAKGCRIWACEGMGADVGSGGPGSDIHV